MNCYSVNLATGTQNLFTGAKLVAIFIVVVGGLMRIFQGEVKYISAGFDGSKLGISDLATAFYSKSSELISTGRKTRATNALPLSPSSLSLPSVGPPVFMSYQNNACNPK